jgi:hypothetical protein
MRSGAPVDLSQATVEFATANPSVASIDSQGVVTGVGQGETKVWAEVTLNGHTKLAVVPVKVDDNSVIVYPTDDAHVRDGIYADINYGNYQQLETKNDNTTDYTRQAFMKFRLDGVDFPIDSAKLLVYAAVTETGQTEATLGVYAAEGDWSEKTLYYNNRPQVTELLNSVPVTNQFAWHEIDITPYVRERQEADGVVNLSLHQRRDVDGTGKMINIGSRTSNEKPYLRLTPAVPQTADKDNNWVTISPDAVDLGGSFTLTAGGDRQAEAGLVVGDERYVPASWISSEPGKSGVFEDQGGFSAAKYTPSTPGTYQVTVRFALQLWDGSAWTEVPEGADEKTATAVVRAPEGSAAWLQADAQELYPGQSVEFTVSVTDATYQFTAFDVAFHFDPQLLAFDIVQEGATPALSETALESLNEHFAVTSAVRPDTGEIRLIAFTAGNEHAVSGTASMFRLRGKVRYDAAPDSTTTAYLTDAEVSFGDLGYSLLTGHASVTLRIIEKPAEVDKGELAAEIANAEALHAGAVVGSQPGQYPASAKDALYQAILAAKAVYEREDVSQEEVDQAAAALRSAVQTFLNSVIKPRPADVTALAAEIEKAQRIHDQAKAGNKIGQYPPEAKSALHAAIQAAKAVRDSGTTSQSEVDQALQALRDALDRFSREIVTLVPGATQVTIRDLSILAQYYGINASDPNWHKVAAADIDDAGVITIETLARVARMILDEWVDEQ